MGRAAVDVGRHYVELGISKEAFGAALLGGLVITLLTWMQHSTESVGARMVAAVGGAFLLAAGPLDHSVVGSLEMFAALQAGAPFGYRDWLGAFAVAVVGNAIGGLALVTALRLLQAGERVQEVRAERG